MEEAAKPMNDSTDNRTDAREVTSQSIDEENHHSMSASESLTFVCNDQVDVTVPREVHKYFKGVSLNAFDESFSDENKVRLFTVSSDTLRSIILWYEKVMPMEDGANLFFQQQKPEERRSFALRVLSAGHELWAKEVIEVCKLFLRNLTP